MKFWLWNLAQISLLTKKRSTASRKWILTGTWTIACSNPGCTDLRSGDLELKLLSNRGEQGVNERSRVVFRLWDSIKHKTGKARRKLPPWKARSPLSTKVRQRISHTSDSSHINRYELLLSLRSRNLRSVTRAERKLRYVEMCEFLAIVKRSSEPLSRPGLCQWSVDRGSTLRWFEFPYRLYILNFLFHFDLNFLFYREFI